MGVEAWVEDELAALGDPAVILLIMERARSSSIDSGRRCRLLAAAFATSKVANIAGRRKINALCWTSEF